MVWPYHEERGRVNAQSYDAVKGEWKEIKRRPRLRWLDNIDRHQKGKNTFLKEVLRTKCFENRQDWRTLISQSTDSNSGEYPLAPPWSVMSSGHHSPLLQIMIQCTMLRCNSTFYYDTYGSSAGILKPTASSCFLDRELHPCTGSPPPRKSTVDYFTPIHQPFKDTRNGIVVLSCQHRPWFY